MAHFYAIWGANFFETFCDTFILPKTLPDYCDKYSDRSNNDISIDFYATKDCHYKIWCIENANISESAWYQIAALTLHPEYSSLFDEMLGVI